MSTTRLVLIDAMGALYRAFYAIRDLSTSGGQPTNALFGFVRMLRELRRSREPSHWAVVFDGGVPRERLDLLPTYKAQRPPMPDALRAQLPLVDALLDAVRVPRLRMEGQEADDLMASAAARFAALHNDGGVLIATSDKDLYQAVNDRVGIAPLSGSGNVMGPDEVEGKTGVRPEHIVEWLALTGDSVDNIPGVPGVGPKTAAGLLREFGSLEELGAGLDRVSRPKLRERLREHWDTVVRNVALVRLRADLPLDPGPEAMEVGAPDRSRLIALLRELEFESMVRELEQADLFGGGW